MRKNGKQSSNLAGVALEYSDGLSLASIIALSLVSLLCAACNVAVPLLQKRILENLDSTTNEFIWLMGIVAAGGCLFLLLENFLNISIMLRFRRELEDAMFESLAFKEQALIHEKGVGVFAATSVGDSEQLARVLAAGWFSLVFNFVGAVVSIVISATWETYFLYIVLAAYVLILVLIFACNKYSVFYFWKEKNVGYGISADVREMADTHRSIFTFGSFLGYQRSLLVKRNERGRYAGKSERAAAFGAAMIRLVQMLALVAFFFFAANDLRSLDPAARAAKYPVIIALVAFLEAIFAPIGTLNTTYNLALKFRAFYEPYKRTVARESLGEVPTGLGMHFHDVTLIQDGELILAGFDMTLDHVYSVHGLDGEAKSRLISYLRGESYPPDGHISLGGARLYEIEKYLRLGLLTFNSTITDMFDKGLEFNVTLGKALVGDARYDSLWQDYEATLYAFFDLVDREVLFRRKNRLVALRVLGDFFAFDAAHLKVKTLQNEIYSTFKAVRNREEFIDSVGRAIFSRRYAKKSRYDALIHELGIESLQEREFGANGKKLTTSDRALVLLARFMLPQTNTPFVLLDPMEYIPPERYNAALHALLEATKGRPGLIFSQDVEAASALAERVLLFRHGHLVANDTHKKLVRSNKEYRQILGKDEARPVRSEEPEKKPAKKKKPTTKA